MGMAVSVLCCGIAFSVYVIWVEFSYSPLRPYLNWDYVHSNFSRVGQFPWILYPDWYWMSFFRAWLIVPISAYIFFLFFGFGEEAMREYKSWVRAFRVYVLRQDVPPVFVGGENWSTWGFVFVSSPFALLYLIAFTLQTQYPRRRKQPSRRQIPASKLVHPLIFKTSLGRYRLTSHRARFSR
jgi:hypothetical protein